MKRLATILFITCLSLGSNFAKEITFNIKSEGYEILNANIQLNCLDRSPVTEMLSLGHGGYEYKRTGVYSLAIAGKDNGSYDLTLSDKLRYPNKNVFNTKCFTNFILEVVEEESGIQFKSSRTRYGLRQLFDTAIKGRKLKKVKRKLSELELCSYHTDKDSLDKHLFFCKDDVQFDPNKTK